MNQNNNVVFRKMYLFDTFESGFELTKLLGNKFLLVITTDE